MINEVTFHRAQRLSAIERWAKVGVLEQRAPLPIEQAFDDRIKEKSGQFFRPVALNDLAEMEFHRELSYLIDAFDALPKRVDQAFDSTWKALELETKRFEGKTITDRLETASLRLDPGVVAEICSSIPVQTCEYAFKRLVSDFITDEADVGLERRVNRRATPLLRKLFDYLKATYGSTSSPEARRNGAMLLRRALQGETLTLGSTEDFALDDESLSRFLVLLLLYTARNERFHGASFSPFVSSRATLRTYTHPLFLFLASYYLLLATWLETRSEAIGVSRDEVVESFRENILIALDLFGKHWER